MVGLKSVNTKLQSCHKITTHSERLVFKDNGFLISVLSIYSDYFTKRRCTCILSTHCKTRQARLALPTRIFENTSNLSE